jgi:predicted nucleic acid-binding protein
VEFIGAVTGPSVEFPLDPRDAVVQASIFRVQIRTLQPPESAFDELVEIIQATGRGGRRIFDCFLSAQAKALGVNTICTYNVDDFEGLPGMLVTTPADIDIPAVTDS